jgi:hypothetical protein
MQWQAFLLSVLDITVPNWNRSQGILSGIFAAVLWSLTLREEHRPRVSEDKSQI